MAQFAGSGQVEPLQITMVRVGVALRLSVAVVAPVAAVLGAVGPVRLAWLLPALAVLVGWTAVYVWIGLRDAQPVWLLLGDAAFAGGLGLLLGRLASPAAMEAGAGWVALVVSMAVIAGQFGTRPVIAILAGLVADACYVAGARSAGAPGGAAFAGITFLLQIVLTAAVMRLVRRAGQDADEAFAAYQEQARTEAVEHARRHADRQLLRLLHNGPLTTLTIAGSANLAGHGLQALRRRAAIDAAALRAAGPAPGPSAPVRLDERLSLVAGHYLPALSVTLDLAECTVPAAVADAVGAATAEALENVSRHAGTGVARIDLRADPAVTVTITDEGCGFDRALVPAQRLGVRESIIGQLEAVGGSATVDSVLGRGTVIELGWRG